MSQGAERLRQLGVLAADFETQRTLTRSRQHHDGVDVLANALVLDTRSRSEFASGHLPGALNIPHTVMAAGVTYRVWVQLDPSGLVSERDENNNLIPLNILGSRGAGC